MNVGLLIPLSVLAAVQGRGSAALALSVELVVLTIGVIAICALGWTLHLQRLLRRRTADLELKRAELERESAERRQALDELEFTDRRLRMAMEAAELRTWHWDVAADRFEVVGDRPAMLGPALPRAEAGIDSFLRPVHPDDLATIHHALRQSLETGSALTVQFRVILPTGEVRWKVARGCAVRDAAGIVTSLVGVVLDVTDRRRSEEELQRSEERYRELFENANDIVYTHDLDGNFTSINHAAERVLGFSRAEVLRLNVRDVVAPEQIAVAQRMIAKKVGGDASRTEYELDVLGKDGRRVTLEVNTRLVRHAGHIVGVQGIARDVTERKRLEWQLGQSQKMEAVGQLAGGIAHDFNNLLTAILGNAQLAQLGAPLSDDLAECMREIAGASHRAAALTRQLLVFSRQGQIDRRAVDLSTTLGDFMKMLRRIIGEHIEVRLTTAPGTPPVLADPAQIEQVVLNLAVNARDAMPDGGHLHIAVDDLTLGEHHRDDMPVAAGHWVRVRVSDTGHGIRPDVRQRIFEPFFTTKPVGEGTGLGLAVVYGIVRQHEGTIDVASTVGKGTCFTLLLPAIASEVPGLPESSAVPVAGGRETILVAEDEPLLRRLTERLLTGLGYRVLVAEDGGAALDLFDRHGEEIDLLLLDVVMPGKGGREVHRGVRARGSDVPVVFMTGYSADVAPSALGEETGCRVLYKPYDVDALATAIRDVLAGAGV